jgi:hypothetical protein
MRNIGIGYFLFNFYFGSKIAKSATQHNSRGWLMGVLLPKEGGRFIYFG